jgi:OOP family OmpA-OmpF porin
VEWRKPADSAAEYFKWRDHRATVGPVQAWNILRGLRRRWAPVRILELVFALSVLFAARPVHAQSGYFYLDRAQVSGAPDDGIMVFRPYVGGPTRLYATLSLGYSANPLRAETVTDDPYQQSAIDNPVQGQLITYVQAGFQFFGRFSAAASLPISLVNVTGTDPQGNGIGTGGIGDATSAVHDLRLDLRVSTFETDDGLFRIGGGAAAFMPNGNATAFAGDDQVSGWLFGSAEFDFKSFMLSGTLGPHFRPERSIGGVNGDLYVGSELRWAFGAFVPMREGKLRMGGELFGSTGLDPSLGPYNENSIFSGRNTSLEWMAEARFTVEELENVYINAGAGTRLSLGYGAPDFRAIIQIGRHFDFESTEPTDQKKVRVAPVAEHVDLDTDADGYPDAIDGCPMEKEDGKPPEPSDGCKTLDRDNDGLPDDQDACADEPEDKDKIQDEDGCPEEDADRDGVVDRQDRCPLEPGPPNEDKSKNGCATLTHLTETGEVELLQAIEFETKKAVIKESSFPILDEVLTLLKARPDLRLGVYGHTDNRGGVALNMRLSKERAAACMKYLVDKGIDSSRLESDGFGPNKPVTENNTEAGRAKNRRVEFKVLAQKPEPTQGAEAPSETPTPDKTAP